MLVELADGRDVVVTLHDLPQASDGARNLPRRSEAYRRVAQAARHVVVASRHEERLLRACGADVPCSVVPLPVPDLTHAPAAAPATPLRAVAVLGYLYPGKGHEQVLAALDALPSGAGLTAVGRPSDGHEDLVAALADQARAVGRTVEVTGFVPDADLPAVLRSPVLPVAPHEHLSASGSINAWTGAGRRPLVPRSDYVTELEERTPARCGSTTPGRSARPWRGRGRGRSSPGLHRGRSPVLRSPPRSSCCVPSSPGSRRDRPAGVGGRPALRGAARPRAPAGRAGTADPPPRPARGGHRRRRFPRRPRARAPSLRRPRPAPGRRGFPRGGGEEPGGGLRPG